MDLVNMAFTKALIKGYIDSQQAGSSDMTYYYCSANEYDAQTGVPTVASPEPDTFYIVPGSGDDIMNIYIYKNNAWELFKSASIVTDLENILVVE